MRQEVCGGRVEVGQPVKPFRPGSLQIVTQTQIQSQLVGCMPGISEIDRPINLLSRCESRNDRLSKKMVYEVVKIVRISEQEICKRKAGPGDPWQAGEARLARSAEIESSARDVGLRVIVAADLELGAELVLVAPPHHGDAWRQVVLGVAILNEALPLGTNYIIGKVCDARRRRRAHDSGDTLVVNRWPTDCG